MTTRQERIERFKEDTKNVSKTTTFLLWIFGLTTIALLVASFVVPPTGVIDPSTLKAGALLFGFATLAEAREAIREGLGVKLTHGQTTVEIHDLDGNPEHPHPHGHAHVYEPETDLEDETERH